MKKLYVALVLLICVLCASLLFACSEEEYKYTPLKAKVRFLTNIEGETITLSSGRQVISENIVFKSQEVKTGDVLKEPASSPTRQGYDFVGWAIDKEGTALYDFSQKIKGSLNLYAKWVRSESAGDADFDYTEPRLSFVEKIDNSKPFTWTGVCNQPITVVDGVKRVDLTTAGINRLKANAENVKEFLNYTRPSSVSILSATYEETVVEEVVVKREVSVRYSEEASPVVVTVNDVTKDKEITDDTSTPKESIDESTFEKKALRYEATDIASYSIILAGSSSMENWSNSTEYMKPVTTKNVGIGGSASFHWKKYLADRLVIPYNPRAVVFYVGINDIINFGKTGKQTGESLIDLFEYVHERLPDTTVHFILINHVPGYYKGTYKTYIDKANTMVLEYAETHSYLKTIDAGTVLEKKSGDYSEAYFLTDKLHMSQAGYALWGEEVKKAVIKEDKERYGND